MKHLAIIADGNRRWAKANGYPTLLGYDQGLINLENCCQWCLNNNIPYFTVYCFSTENWNRPQNEIQYLLDLAREYFVSQQSWYVNKGIKVQFIGRKDRVAPDLMDKCRKLEQATNNCNNLLLNICLDYGGRDEIVSAIAAGCKTEEDITKFVSHGTTPPDIILRPGGEYRLSNFLLWQSAYAELFFLPQYFPDLSHQDLDQVLEDYHKRTRKFGA